MEEDDKKNESKGFAGLSSLLADGDATTPPAPNVESVARSAPAEGAGAKNDQPPPPPPPPQPPPPPPPPPPQPPPEAPQQRQETSPSPPSQRQADQGHLQPPSSGSSGGKWVLGTIAVIGAFWLFGRPNDDTLSSASANSSPIQTQVPNDSSPSQPVSPARPEESKPPVGQDRVLTLAQIRYCLAEEIRMNGAESNLSASSQSDINRFNGLVADYNSRCGQFRYQQGSLEIAKRDIDQYRAQLLVDGRNRFDYAQVPSDAQPDGWAPAESSASSTTANSPSVAPRPPARNARTRPSRTASAFAPVERTYDRDNSRALEDLSQTHAKEARQRAESEHISSTPGAHKRWDYKTGRDIWVDVNGNPIE